MRVRNLTLKPYYASADKPLSSPETGERSEPGHPLAEFTDEQLAKLEEWLKRDRTQFNRPEGQEE